MKNAAVPNTSPMNREAPVAQSVGKMATAVGVACATVYLLTASYSDVSGDVTATNVLSWQLATLGDPGFGPHTYPPLDEHPGRAIWVIATADGGESIGRSPGAVLAALPAYWAIGGPFSLLPGAITAAILTALSAVLLAVALARRMALRDAALATFVFALGTPVWSVAADGMWPHTITVLGTCGMAWAAGRERWFLAGILGGVVLWGRLHAALIVAVFGVLVGLRRRDLALTARVAAGSGLLLAVQCVWTRWIYGSFNPLSSYDTGPFEDYVGTHGIDVVNHLGFWVSPDRGLLVWSPILLVLIPSLVREWRHLPDWSRALLLGGLAYTLMQGFLNRFSGGDSFYGYRLTLELLACATPALAFASPGMGWVARRLAATVLALQTFVISAGAVNGRLGSPAEDVWRTHTFFAEFVGRPLLLLVFLTICVLAGILGQRIWSNPRVSPLDAQSASRRMSQ